MERCVRGPGEQMPRITRLRSRHGGPTPLNQRSNARDKGVP